MASGEIRSLIVLCFFIAIGCAASDDPPGAAPASSSSSSSSGPPPGTGSSSSSSSTSSTGGCGPDGPACTSSGSAPQYIQLDLVPGDLVTAVAGKPMGARFSGYSNPSSDLLDQVADALELRSYPGLALVPTSTVVTPPGEDVSAFVELKPTAELADTWYVLSLKAIPDGVQLGPGAFGAPPPLAGVSSIRFHPKSHPTVREVEFCKKEDGRYVAVTGFSEPVDSTSFDSLIRVEQSGTTCETLPASPFSFSDEKACTGFSTTTPLHFIVNEGLKSQSGAAFATFTGAATMDQTVDVSKLPKESDFCWLLRL